MRARHSALFVALVDLAFVGTFIAAVYELRGITDESCSNFTAGGFYLSLGPFGYYGRQSDSPWSLHINKTCAMLKASFAFGIMNCIFFFITFVSGFSNTAQKKKNYLTGMEKLILCRTVAGSARPPPPQKRRSRGCQARVPLITSLPETFEPWLGLQQTHLTQALASQLSTLPCLVLA